MKEITVEEVCEETVQDLAWLCVPKGREEDPAFQKGVATKIAWAEEKLHRGEPFAKIAYLGEEPAGLLQYQIHPEPNLVQILCVFVPERRHWGQGVGTSLLSSLVEEMRRPQPWNRGRLPQALVVHTFPGEIEGQLSAQAFFRRRGFQQIGEDPDLLALPLISAPRFPPSFRVETFSPPPPYRPQPEDAGSVVILYGPSFCPWTFVFYAKAERLLREALPGVSIRWADGLAHPQELEKRGGFTGVVVNARAIAHSVFEEEAFIAEVKEAWKEGG
ncbi:MAG: GNAT family N-acetyltransferase [Candidatus Bipolaricaulaceae bacterium]